MFSLYSSGKVVPLTEEIIISPIHSRILEIYKNPGEKVERGEAILKLDLASVETEYQQKLDEREMKNSRLAQLKVNSAGKISEMRMQLKIKDMQLKQAYTELKNEQYLDSIGASTSDKIRQIELNYEVARLELEQLKEKMANESKNLDAEMNVQQLDLSIFDKSLAEKQRLLKDARILSPLEATLTFVNNEIGSQVGAGAQIAIVSDLSRFKIEASITDSYGDYIRPGNQVMVSIGNKEMEGSILNIVPSSKNGTISFTVLLQDMSNSILRSGLKADLHVITGIRDNTLRIKNGSYYLGPKKYNLWVIKGNKASMREVDLGECSYDYVEVLSGLEKGEEVIIHGMERQNANNIIKINR